nr:RHS repeat domain-containing protein [Pseudomonas synxantha]
MSHSVEFGYDAYGRLLHLSNENRERYRFEWDALDRLLAQQDLDGSGHIYQYDPVGRGHRHPPYPRAAGRTGTGRQRRDRAAHAARALFRT